MIEQYIVSELNTFHQLKNQLYPAASPVGDDEPPFCIYTRVSGDVQRDLSGDPVYYRDVFRLDLFGDDTDALFALEQEMIAGLSKVNVDAGDVYIFSAEAAPGSADGFDLTMELHMRSISYTITYWR